MTNIVLVHVSVVECIKERMMNKRVNRYPLCRASSLDNLSHKLFLDYSGLQKCRKGLEITNHVTRIFFT